ncbi:murein biosynthesis integral membrane protein MurJ [Desulfofundulus thermocisternus]|uniref:murein biosynthesis integral membrane protein MurJ n=1 Tax=Desulfofundulus thermocisternus TaxID=42471 RepID=UPI00217CFFB3|nr:murein biosynthesis integral membrane protein MurJ [Desulfofundulus thermocisternus]
MLVMGATILSKIMGFGREAVLAAVFGASAATDAYLVAMIIPVLLFGLVGTTITTVGIPFFSEYLHRAEKRSELPELIWTCFHAVTGILLVVALLGIPAAPWLVGILAPGFGPEQAELTTRLVRVLLPMVVIMGMVGWAQGVLNAHQHFAAPAFMGIPYNIIMITGILLAGAYGGIAGVAWATVLATASQFFIQLPALYRRGITYRPVFNHRHPALKKMLWLAGPVLIGVGANQLNVIVDRMLASGLAEGSISALNYAQRVLNLPQGLFAVPLITVLYPALTERRALEDAAGFRAGLVRGLRVLAFVLVPLTVGMMVLREDLVRFIFQRGAFDSRDAAMTAVALFFYTPGLLFLMWREFLNRAFYALQDTWTPMTTGLAAVAVNIALNLILVRYLGLAGLALATSAAAGVGCLLLFWLLRRRLGHIGGRVLVGQVGRVLVSSLLMGLLVWWLDGRGLALAGWPLLEGLVGQFMGGSPGDFVLQGLRLGVLIAAGGCFYFLSCWLLRVGEVYYALELARNILCRFRPAARGKA